ncbi:MAG: hypothetical protein L7S48_05630, partial [Candidatus Poseidonia sp.]|nr:hypothetical protein [Poseidonia sp.]
MLNGDRAFIYGDSTMSSGESKCEHAFDVDVRWLAHAATVGIQANEAEDAKDVDESPTVCEGQK